MTDDGFVSEATVHQQGTIGGVKLNLPIDEDDYLMPSAQPTTAKTHYIDIIADANPAGKIPFFLSQMFMKFWGSFPY